MAESRQIHVLLTLLDGERSFGMSLAQKRPALGTKYTVVSSVFANSPAARAGVRQGYVVRYINDKPMGGLTVEQVAKNFRKVAQARITLEVVENVTSPWTATFGGVAASSASGQRSPAPVTGFSAASSGRAIAAPGTALAAPKQSVLRLGAKPAAKALATAGVTMRGREKEMGPRAEAKTISSASHSGLTRNAVAPVLRLGPTPKPVQADVAVQRTGDGSAKKVDLKAAAKSATEISAAEKQTASSAVPRSPIQAIEAPRSAPSAQAKKAVVTAIQPKSVAVPPVHAKVSASGPVPPKAAAPTPPTKAAVPTSTSAASTKSATVVTTLTVKATPATVVAPAGNAVLPTPTPSQSSNASAAALMVSGAQRSTTVPGSSAQSIGPTSTTKPPAAARNTNSAQSVAPMTIVASSRSTSSPQVRSVPESTVPAASSALPVSAPETTAVSARSIPPPPVVIPATPQTQPSRSATATPVRSPARGTVVARSAPAPAVVAPTSTPARTKTGRKRGRSRKNAVVTNGTTSNKGKAKAKRQHKQEEDEAVGPVVDDDEVFGLYAFTESSDSDLEESPSKKATRRTGKGRRRGVTDRTRHSLTIDRLVGMGFAQEDAEASVKEKGDDPDACMLWIISKMEERQFTQDLNRASIQSEESKRDEEQRVKKLEKEVIVQAEKFMSNFATSYINSADSNAPNLKNVLASTINEVHAETYLREILTKLLTLEGKSIGWYRQATRSYMLELAGRLETALGSHDVMTCCSRVSASWSGSCAFVQKLVGEEKALTRALFDMPTNQGGVPPVFLECDEAIQFDLEDDGFEVLDG